MRPPSSPLTVSVDTKNAISSANTRPAPATKPGESELQFGHGRRLARCLAAAVGQHAMH